MLSSRFMLFPKFKKNKKWCRQKITGGGGQVLTFFRKRILSHFMFYAIFNIKKNDIEKCPFKFPGGGGGC